MSGERAGAQHSVELYWGSRGKMPSFQKILGFFNFYPNDHMRLCGDDLRIPLILHVQNMKVERTPGFLTPLEYREAQ